MTSRWDRRYGASGRPRGTAATSRRATAIVFSRSVLVLVLLVAPGRLRARARVACLVGLERQRTRISMDLHDEVGSGLASVGILSGVLAADGVSVAEARIAAGERRYLIFMRGVRTGAD